MFFAMTDSGLVPERELRDGFPFLEYFFYCVKAAKFSFFPALQRRGDSRAKAVANVIH
jgi:hypothetical protein